MRRTAKHTTPAKFSELPKSYAALCAILMPRAIHDGIELESVTEIRYTKSSTSWRGIS